VIGLGKGGIKEKRLENYVVSGLVDFDDIDYEKHADLLYELASQTVEHFKSYLSAEDAGKVLWRHQKEIAAFIHAQMQEHYWEDDAVENEVKINKGFTELSITSSMLRVRMNWRSLRPRFEANPSSPSTFD